MQIFKVNQPLSIVPIAALGLCLAAHPALAEVKAQPNQVAQYANPAKQDLSKIKQKVSDFLTTQTMGYPGRVTVEVGNLDPNLKLAVCADVNVFIPNGNRPWGRTSIGVRCTAPSAWTIYMQANVNVESQYWVAASPLVQGQVLTSSDILVETGDITQLPAGVVTEPAQAVGRTVNMSMRAGAVLRQDMLKQSPVIQQGQTVTLISIGQGFSISAEGQAMAKASEGQVVQVKVANGQLVSGIAHQGGKVEVTY